MIRVFVMFRKRCERIRSRTSGGIASRTEDRGAKIEVSEIIESIVLSSSE